MLTKWTSHLSDPEEKGHFVNKIISSKPVLDRLGGLLEEEETNLDSREVSIKSFESPNWAYRQAYMNGYRACLAVVNKIIDLDQQKKD